MITATSVSAELFGVSDDLVTLEPGGLADLVAIDGNPFQDFDALIRSSWVMRDGVAHRQDDPVGAFAIKSADQPTADRSDWLTVSRELRRKPCCSRHTFDVQGLFGGSGGPLAIRHPPLLIVRQ